MPKNVKVSFIVAVYKVAEYIERCVRSIYEQTLEDIEIILVDDCTPDNSIEIAKRVLEDYPQRASQMKVLRHEKNTGLKGVRKDGVKVAEGEYVIFVDGDDYLDVRMGEMMYSKAIEEEAEMVICGFWWYRKDGRFFRMPLGIDSLESTQKIKDATFDRMGWPNVWCRMVKRTLLQSDEMIWPKESHPEDVVISTVSTYYAKKIACVIEPLYHYCYNKDSITFQSSEEGVLRKYREFLINNEQIVDFYKQKGIFERNQRGLVVNMMYTRNELLMLTRKRKYRKMWKETYPELNKIMMSGNEMFSSTYREKVWYISIMLGLFPLFKRVLVSRRLRPSGVWMAGASNFINK